MIKFAQRKIFKYILVLLVLVLLYIFGLLSPLEVIVLKIMNPALSYVQNFSTSILETYNEQTSRVDVNQKNRDLQSELNRLLSLNAEYEIIKEENEIMRKYLDFFSKNNYKKEIAGVISRGNYYDSAGRVEVITIAKGANDGLYEGLVVLNEDGMVVGKISKVKSSISEVALLSNDECKIAATIMGVDKTSGIVEGELGLTMKMNFIPQSNSINEGDIVISSGLEQAIPRGLVIGQVSEVVKESNELWQEAVVDSNVNFSELIIVTVLLPDLENNLELEE